MPYKCVCCQVVFALPDPYRDHYKSDWHSYNLKRKVAELPPVTAEDFDERLLAFNKQHSQINKSAPTSCDVCHKYFGTKNSLRNHMKSKSHLDALNKKQKQLKSAHEKNEKRTCPEDADLKLVAIKERAKKVVNLSFIRDGSDIQESVDSDTVLLEGGDIDNDEMSIEDGSDGEWESCDDDEEEEEGEGIPVNKCLFCLYECENIEANIGHMTISHSFFIPDIEYVINVEGLIQCLGEKIGNDHLCIWCHNKGKTFHSVRSVQQHMLDKGHCKMLHEGIALLDYAPFYDYSSSYPDTEQHNADDDIEIPHLDCDNWQLVLPSGVTIGHRLLARYYRQALPPTRPGAQGVVHRVIAQYRSLKWTETKGEVAVKKARDISFMKKIQAKQALKLGLSHNKVQHHFRSQIMF